MDGNLKLLNTSKIFYLAEKPCYQDSVDGLWNGIIDSLKGENFKLDINIITLQGMISDLKDDKSILNDSIAFLNGRITELLELPSDTVTLYVTVEDTILVSKTL